MTASIIVYKTMHKNCNGCSHHTRRNNTWQGHLKLLEQQLINWLISVQQVYCNDKSLIEYVLYYNRHEQSNGSSNNRLPCGIAAFRANVAATRQISSGSRCVEFDHATHRVPWQRMCGLHAFRPPSNWITAACCGDWFSVTRGTLQV